MLFIAIFIIYTNSDYNAKEKKSDINNILNKNVFIITNY